MHRNRIEARISQKLIAYTMIYELKCFEKVTVFVSETHTTIYISTEKRVLFCQCLKCFIQCYENPCEINRNEEK